MGAGAPALSKHQREPNTALGWSRGVRCPILHLDCSVFPFPLHRSSVGLEKRKTRRTLLGDIALKTRSEGLRSEGCACFLLRWKGTTPEQSQASGREQLDLWSH